MNVHVIRYNLYYYRCMISELKYKLSLIKQLLITEMYDVDDRFIYNIVVDLVLHNLSDSEIEMFINYYNAIKNDPNRVPGGNMVGQDP